MAEILALGIAHYPPLIGPDDRMSGILRRMLQNPELPPDAPPPETCHGSGRNQSVLLQWRLASSAIGYCHDVEERFFCPTDNREQGRFQTALYGMSEA